MERFTREELELRYYHIIDTAVDGIITINSQGIMETANRSICQLFGYDAEELIGKNVSILMPEPHRERHNQYIRNYLNSGTAKIIGIGRALNGQRKDGSIFPMWLSVSEIRLGNKLIFTGFVNDISELSKAREELKQLNEELERKVFDRTEQLARTVNQLLDSNQRLASEVIEREIVEKALQEKQAQLQVALDRERELGELKTRFVSMASHEFRTPLTTILSSTSLAKKYTEASNPDKLVRHLEKIKAAVIHMTNILNDFLNLNKLEDGQIAIKHEPFHFLQFCQEIMEELSGMTKPGQKIICHKEQSEDTEINSDRGILRNILYNLISNAIKYSDQNIDVYLKIEGNHARIDVQDHGIGIPKEDQKHLFERFFRAHNATNISGTGLGLNIVKRYADLLKGNISFTSEEGKGSTFTIIFPLTI